MREGKGTWGGGARSPQQVLEGTALARACFFVDLGSFGLAGSERDGVSPAHSSVGLAGSARAKEGNYYIKENC